jgi:hypothetical protein
MRIENAMLFASVSEPARIVSTSNWFALQSGAVAETTANAVERGDVVPECSTEANAGMNSLLRLNAVMQYLPVLGRVTFPISFDRVTVQVVPLQLAGSIEA